NQRVYDVAVNSSGAVAIVGSLSSGEIDFGGGPRDSTNGPRFVAVLEANGGHRWSRMVGPKILAAAWTPDESSLIVSGYLEGANQAIDNVMVPAGDEVFWFELSGATGAAAHGGAVGPPLAGGVYQDLVVDDDAAV